MMSFTLIACHDSAAITPRHGYIRCLPLLAFGCFDDYAAAALMTTLYCRHACRHALIILIDMPRRQRRYTLFCRLRRSFQRYGTRRATPA